MALFFHRLRLLGNNCWFCCDCWMLLILNCCDCCDWFHLRREVEVGGGLRVVVNCDFSFRQILFKQWVWQKLENDFLWFFFDKQRVGQRIGNDILWFFFFPWNKYLQWVGRRLENYILSSFELATTFYIYREYIPNARLLLSPSIVGWASATK